MSRYDAVTGWYRDEQGRRISWRCHTPGCGAEWVSPGDITPCTPRENEAGGLRPAEMCDIGEAVDALDVRPWPAVDVASGIPVKVGGGDA